MYYIAKVCYNQQALQKIIGGKPDLSKELIGKIFVWVLEM